MPLGDRRKEAQGFFFFFLKQNSDDSWFRKHFFEIVLKKIN